MSCIVLQRVSVCYNELQCAAMCCSELQCVVASIHECADSATPMLHGGEVSCGELQRPALCFNQSQCVGVAECCSELQ